MVYGKVRHNYFLNIKVIIGTLKRYDSLFNKLPIKTTFYPLLKTTVKMEKIMK